MSKAKSEGQGQLPLDFLAERLPAVSLETPPAAAPVVSIEFARDKRRESSTSGAIKKILDHANRLKW